MANRILTTLQLFLNTRIIGIHNTVQKNKTFFKFSLLCYFFFSRVVLLLMQINILIKYIGSRHWHL